MIYFVVIYYDFGAMRAPLVRRLTRPWPGGGGV